MKRIFEVLLVACYLMLYSLVFASERERKAGVFFCTCDLGFSETKGMQGNKSLEGYDNMFIVVDINDTDRHKQLRHCFLLLATEITGMIKNKLVLEMAASAGYYYNPTLDKGIVYSEDFWLLNANERKKFVISCTPVIHEGTVDRNKKNPASVVSEDDIQEVWNNIYFEILEDARKSPSYDRDTHNCCTVAFESLRKINKNSEKFSLDLLHIKKRSFNIFGHGISFDSKDDSIFDYIEGSRRIVFDSLSSVPKIIIRSIIENVSKIEYAEKEDL